MIQSFIFSFFITVSAEFIVAALIFRKYKFAKLFLYIFLINLATQPFANFLFNYLNINFYLIEFGVIIVETLLIKVLFEETLIKSLIFSIIINTTTSLLALILMSSAPANNILLQNCSNSLDIENCFVGELMAEVAQNPEKAGELQDSVWKLISENKVDLDGRKFIDLGHNLGMLMVNKNVPLESAIQDCGLAFKQACMHGVVMEYLDNNTEDIYSFCNKVFISQNKIFYLNCLHAVGHIITARSKEDLNKTLKKCDFVSGYEKLSACASGVFMEYSKGEMGSGEHSHEPIFSKEIDCSGINENFLNICKGSVGSYSQFYKDDEELSTSFSRCSDLDTNYNQSCTNNLADRLYNAAAGSPEKTFKLCKSVSDFEIQNSCFNSLINIALTQYNDYSFALKLLFIKL